MKKTSKEEQAYLKRLAELKPMNIIDLGGRTTKKIVCVDIAGIFDIHMDLNSCSEANEFAPREHWDEVWLKNVLSYLANDEKRVECLRECSRLMSSSGVVRIENPNYGYKKDWAGGIGFHPLTVMKWCKEVGLKPKLRTPHHYIYPHGNHIIEARK